MSTTPAPLRPGLPDHLGSGGPGPWAICFRARLWRMLILPRRMGVPRLREAMLSGPWLELGSTSGRWRWLRGTVDVACTHRPRASWTKALPSRMLMVAPRTPWREIARDQDRDAAESRAIVFDCAGLTANDFTQLRRHLSIFTESALLREAILRPNLEDGRFWERPSSASPES